MDTNPSLQTIPQQEIAWETSRFGKKLAFCNRKGLENRPTLVFLPGYRSDMTGSKAEFLDEWAIRTKTPYLRLDYSGHGKSEGQFEDGTIGEWSGDALEIIDRQTRGPIVLVGSSMGGWIGLLVAIARPQRVKAFVGISAAPDFTKWVWDNHLTEEQKTRCLKEGRLEEKSPYSDEPDLMTLRLFEDGKTHLVLENPIPFDGPVVLLQGKMDREVPWTLSRTIAARLKEGQTRFVDIDDGEHRLSRPEDLACLEREINALYDRL